MTTEELRQMHQACPFRPFRVHLADGRHLDVAHPEFLAHTPTGPTVTIARPVERLEVVDLLLVTSVEPIDGKPHAETGLRGIGDRESLRRRLTKDSRPLIFPGGNQATNSEENQK